MTLTSRKNSFMRSWVVLVRELGIGALVLSTLAAYAPARAQPVSVVVPGGREVEILGLRRWTLSMLRDSLSKYAPTDSLHTSACAAALRYKLGFADASLTEYDVERNAPSRIVLAVREPQDSALVQYRRVALDSVGERRSWKTASTVMRTRPRVFWTVLGVWLSDTAAPPPPMKNADDSLAARQVIQFYRSHRSERDRRDALSVLAKSRNMYDRSVAAVLLARFADRDDTWWALTRALVETDGPVKAVAIQVLHAGSRRAPRVVNWRPVAATVRALLNGTSLFVLPEFIAVLQRSQVAPKDAGILLAGSGDMLLTFLESKTSALSDPSHSLLVLLRGEDLGKERAPWERWVKGL